MRNNEIVPGFDEEKDDTLKVTLKGDIDIEGCLVLQLHGYIDTYNSNIFQKRINRAIEAGYVRLVFQCDQLSYVSSTGIGSFVAFFRVVKPRGGDLVMVSISPKVYEVFQLLGFAQFFNFKDTLGDAFQYFKEDKKEIASHVFPKIFQCPICSKRLKAVKMGRFRCPQCKTILAIDNSGQVLLG